MSTEVGPAMLLGYVARSATRIGEVLWEVLGLYPDGKNLFDAEKVAEGLVDVMGMLRDSMVGPGEAG